MKLSVRAIRRLPHTRPSPVFAERAFDRGEGANSGFSAFCGAGPRWNCVADFRADMLKESGHNGKTANDDARRNLGSAP